jgi:hypothetical protein
MQTKEEEERTGKIQQDRIRDIDEETRRTTKKFDRSERKRHRFSPNKNLYGNQTEKVCDDSSDQRKPKLDEEAVVDKRYTVGLPQVIIHILIS